MYLIRIITYFTNHPQSLNMHPPLLSRVVLHFFKDHIHCTFFFYQTSPFTNQLTSINLKKSYFFKFNPIFFLAILFSSCFTLIYVARLQAYGNAFHYMESLMQAKMEVGDENLTDPTTSTISRQSLPSSGAASTISAPQASAQTLLANAFANYSALSVSSAKPVMKSRKFDVTQVCTCGRKFSYENLYAYHKRWECGQELTCRFCLRSYCSVYYVKRHMKTCKKRGYVSVGMNNAMHAAGGNTAMSGPPRKPETPGLSHNLTL